MTFEKEVLKGMGLRRYTFLLTNENKSSIVPTKRAAMRVPIAERINETVIRIRK